VFPEGSGQCKFEGIEGNKSRGGKQTNIFLLLVGGGGKCKCEKGKKKKKKPLKVV